jgi:mono/diheme cytochrome c family protein
MNRNVCVLVVAVLLVTTTRAADRPTDPKVKRGRYLVTSVSMCGDCHSPMNEKGEPIEGQWLKGSVLTFKPAVEMPVWADRAPGIAGLAGWSDQEALEFLMTGLDSNGKPARPPMPQYRLSKEDASAVLAYLRSLAPKKKGN